MTASIVWLASYPKSGNTWVRAIITALGVHDSLFNVDGLGSGAQPHGVSSALSAFGIDARWLVGDELDITREALIRRPLDIADGRPWVRKTHERYRRGEPGRQPFPVEATRAALLVVRDPRDVACSYAPFFGVTQEEAVEAMARESKGGTARPSTMQTPQPWGSWSSHTRSWLDTDVPFPVHMIKYEDLSADPVATLEPAFDAIGLQCTTAELTRAVQRARFDKLQQDERERGFHERSPKTEQFFRKGRSGGWREELRADLVIAVEADHGETMQEVGYHLTTTREQREANVDIRRSRRLQQEQDWLQGPPELGLDVSLGKPPEALPGASRPRRWMEITPNEALVTFAEGTRLYVANGRDVVLEIPDEDAEPSWLVQGWAATLASLQRGDISLHACTVRIGEAVVALAGRSGAGKSTTSMALRKAGHTILVDDVTILDLGGEDLRMRPFSRNVHLLPDSAHALGLDFNSLPPLSGAGRKASFRPEQIDAAPVTVDAIVLLDPRPEADGVLLEQVTGRERLTALDAHTRRTGIAPLVLGYDRYFELTAEVADRCPVWRLVRPKQDWTLDQVVATIEELAQRYSCTSPAATSDSM